MTRLEARINLRLAQDVFDTYAKVAQAFNTTVTEMLREIVNQGVEEMQIIGSVIDAAKAGDQEAAAKIYRLLMDQSQGRVDLARATGEFELGSVGSSS
jgi:predicted DNA-binding protein